MTLEQIIPWVLGITAVLTLWNLISAPLTSGSKENGRRINVLDERVDAHDRRIQDVENEMRHLPGKDAVHRLELALGEMKTEMTKVGGAAEQAARTASRVEEYLLNERTRAGK